jgi:Protein of unknown function (DUF3176)
MSRPIELDQAQYPFLSGDYQQHPPTPYAPPHEYTTGYQGSWITTPPLPPPPAPQPGRRTFATRLRQFAYRTWLVEFIFLAVAALFLVLILILLAIYNHQPLQTSGSGWFSSTPSSTLNFLVTSMKTAMLLPVASGIAQLKWKWFEDEKKLADVEVFDDATRGPVGSLQLLFRPKFWYVQYLVL